MERRFAPDTRADLTSARLKGEENSRNTRGVIIFTVHARREQRTVGKGET